MSNLNNKIEDAFEFNLNEDLSENYYQHDDNLPYDHSFKRVVELTLDDALELNSVSFFQYRILLMCGFAFMADSLEVNLLSFLSTCAGDEWHLSDTQKATITGSVFLGVLFGTIFWGEFSARYGRKLTFIVGCSLVAISGVLSGLSPSYYWLLLFRSIVGFGVGGAYVPFDLLAEFLPPSHRGKFLIYIEIFWTVGSLMVAGLAWTLLPTYGWRVLAYVTAVPVTVTSVVSAYFLPESPRWLLAHGRVAEAVAIVSTAAKLNGITMEPFTLVHREQLVRSRFSHSSLSLSEVKQITVKEGVSPTSSSDSVEMKTAVIITNTRNESSAINKTLLTNRYTCINEASEVHSNKFHHDVVSPLKNSDMESENYWDLVRSHDMRCITIPLWLVWFASGYAYYGLILFVGRLYSNTSEEGTSCSFSYSSIFVNASAELAGILLSALMVDTQCFGRIMTQFTCYLACAIMVFLVGLHSADISSPFIISIAFIGRMAIMSATNGTWVSTPELFSTELRTLGHAVCNLFSKLGAFLVPFLVQDYSISASTVGTVLALFSVLSALAVLTLPETAGTESTG